MTEHITLFRAWFIFENSGLLYSYSLTWSGKRHRVFCASKTQTYSDSKSMLSSPKACNQRFKVVWWIASKLFARLSKFTLFILTRCLHVNALSTPFSLVSLLWESPFSFFLKYRSLQCIKGASVATLIIFHQLDRRSCVRLLSEHTEMQESLAVEMPVLQLPPLRVSHSLLEY